MNAASSTPWLLLALALTPGLAVTACRAPSPDDPRDVARAAEAMRAEACRWTETLTRTQAAEPLDAVTQEALRAALDDERHAQALYAAVQDRFGERRPFSNIAQAEERHESHLLAIFAAHGMAVPEDRWAGTKVPVPATFAEACQQAAQAERDNVALYDRLLPTISAPDVRAVFTALRDASRDHHLPALERCGSRGRRGPRT